MTFSELLSKYREFLLYGIIGGFSALLDFTVYTLILRFTSTEDILMVNAISVLCGIATSFLLNRQFNFKVKDHAARRFVAFLLVGLFGLAVSTLLIYLLAEILFWNNLIAKLFTIVVVSIFQFILNKTISFKALKK